MKNPFLNLFHALGKPRDTVSAATMFFFGSSASGKAVNPKNAVRVSTVYACLRVIAETIASLPMGVYEASTNGVRSPLDHPLYRLLHDDPNPETASFVWWETIHSRLLLRATPTARSSEVGEAIFSPCTRSCLTVWRWTGTARQADLCLYYHGRRTLQLCPEDVPHIPGLGFDGIMGYSPIAP